MLTMALGISPRPPEAACSEKHAADPPDPRLPAGKSEVLHVATRVTGIFPFHCMIQSVSPRVYEGPGKSHPHFLNGSVSSDGSEGIAWWTTVSSPDNHAFIFLLSIIPSRFLPASCFIESP